jgi:transaldolase
MIKIPATDAGLAALPALVADDININLTLLFSRAQTVRAYQAYQQGLAQRAGQAAPQLVASFFISRIDTALDPQLPPQLQGKTALALAQAAYRDWQQFFGQPSDAVPTARLLWASTGVKNPAYPDTLYVDNLIAPHTVNTLPDAVLQAFTDHGRAADALSRPAVPAQPILDEVAALGIDLEALAAKLQQDGLAQFEQAFAQMLAPLAD